MSITGCFGVCFALQADRDELLNVAERRRVEDAMTAVEHSLDGTDAAAVKGAVKGAVQALERACRSTVERCMKAGMRKVMAGRKAQEFEKRSRHAADHIPAS